MKKRVLCFLLLFLLLWAGAAGAESGLSGQGTVSSLDALDGKRIGVPTGTNCGPEAEARLPNAEIQYFNNHADMLKALRSGKVDAIVTDAASLRFLQIENDDLEELEEKFSEMLLAPIFPKTEKGEALCGQYSAFVRELRADGTLDALQEVWLGRDESLKTVLDYEALPGGNGTLTMALDATLPPFAYVKDGRIVGYDVDIAARFCEAYGYRLKIINSAFDGVLASVQSRKCDFASCGITRTDERAEKVLFGEPVFFSGNVAAVLKQKDALSAISAPDGGDSAAPAAGTFLDSIRDSFYKTFIREARWELFGNGVLGTLLITVLSILFGTALGFLVFMLCRNGNAFANGVTRFSTRLVQGMPMVVLLMILYYIVFGSVAVSGIFVAVIGFTLTFGAAVFGLLKMGVGTIDKGQYEAAYALGYANRRTFFRVILPQAIPHILPAYKGEIVGLIKATAIVGYIAVQDLTKMGDIVRSRTYEAFFPLIAVTVIYFALEALLAFLVSRIQIRMNPKKRSPEAILKGIKTHDQD